jgi:hypothetical protein
MTWLVLSFLLNVFLSELGAVVALEANYLGHRLYISLFPKLIRNITHWNAYETRWNLTYRILGSDLRGWLHTTLDIFASLVKDLPFRSV